MYCISDACQRQYKSITEIIEITNENHLFSRLLSGLSYIFLYIILTGF